ncbi:MAG TPA: MASE1 domain-containing protein [Polyangia bacterium]|jgi:signal transduction histidine kinase|nr:MASE1 domain-containing protein [Polyangia bacterium]
MPESSPAPTLALAAKGVLLLVVYLGTAKLGLSFDALGGVASTVWPPTGIAIVALFLYGHRLWPAIALGAFIANQQAGMPLVTVVLMAAGNTLEAVAGAAILRRGGFGAHLDRLRDVFLLLVAALVSTTISASGGVLGLLAGGVAVSHGYDKVWTVWWLGDVMGDLLVAPLLFTWVASRGHSQAPPRYVEAALFAFLLTLVTVIVFAGLLPPQFTELLRQSHVIFPLLIWSAFRFGPRGATAATFGVSVLAVASTALGFGPFVRATRHDSLLSLQSYMAVEVITLLTLAAAIAERRRAVRARDEFISIASHELKTPITALKLRLDLLARALYDTALPTAVRGTIASGLDRAHLQVDRLTRLVDDLLDVSRLVGGRFVLSREPIVLADVVRDVLERLGEELLEAGCPVQLAVEDNLVGQWDRLRLEQVMTNLLTNVIKYAPGAAVKISAGAAGGQARLTISDGGAGISREQQKRIFDPFERGLSSRSVGGLGLGLFIVRQILLAHRGTITVDSEPGHGATFTLVLPCGPPTTRRLPAQPTEGGVAAASPASDGASTDDQQARRP